ncbi:unnamed protein product [Sphagnum troendelagicum]|uniref:Secreted protein n=1 Tax=Sphagnum troendelagicum TaxID=128251 RepID=A0ABP0TLW9_9BRYO
MLVQVWIHFMLYHLVLAFLDFSAHQGQGCVMILLEHFHIHTCPVYIGRINGRSRFSMYGTEEVGTIYLLKESCNNSTRFYN